MTEELAAQCNSKLPASIKGDPIENGGLLGEALGHPTRPSIIKILIDKGTCRTSVHTDELPLAQSTVSEHLHVLRESGPGSRNSNWSKAVLLHISKDNKYLKALINELYEATMKSRIQFSLENEF